MSESVATGYMPSMALKTDTRLVSLTKSQCVNVADFIEICLIQYIKDDHDLDNVLWVADMIDAYRALRDAGGAENG